MRKIKILCFVIKFSVDSINSKMILFISLDINNIFIGG